MLADTLKSEKRNTEATQIKGEFFSPTCFYLFFSKGENSRGVDKNVVETHIGADNDHSGVFCEDAGSCIWVVKLKDRLKRGFHRVRHFPRGTTES